MAISKKTQRLLTALALPKGVALVNGYLYLDGSPIYLGGYPIYLGGAS